MPKLADGKLSVVAVKGPAQRAAAYVEPKLVPAKSRVSS